MVDPKVEASVLDAGRRLADAGWTVEEIDDTPPLNEAAEANEWLWLADGFAQLADAAERDVIQALGQWWHSRDLGSNHIPPTP
jgi:amidase